MSVPGGRRRGTRRRRVLPLFAAAAAASLFGSPSPVRAQGAPTVLAAGSIGPVVLDGEFGLEGAAGVELRWSRLSAGLRGPEVALVPGEAEPGFRWETLSNGQRRCRDAATGRFAADTRCIELATALGASAEATWRVLGAERPLRVGAGVRAGDGAGPYGTVRWRAIARDAGAWHLRASAGPSVLRLAAGFALSL